MSKTYNKVIVVGGGLAGLSAAHTALECGANVVVIEKNSFCGGNSTKATSGINAALTRSQQKLGIQDSYDAFLKDTIDSSKKGKSYELAEVMIEESAPAIEWLIKAFGLDLSLVSRLGGHSFPRTHRGGERFPGMTITYALMEKLEQISEQTPERAKIIVKSRVTELIKEGEEVVGVKFTNGGKTFTEYGAVVLATGGYAADYADDSLLKQYRPDVLKYPTTNGPHATGDGLKMGVKIGAALVDMEQVQIHPTGLVHPDEPENPTKFLAAEALRGVGGLMFDNNGKRFVNELGRRDFVSGEMMRHNQGPYYLVLNGKASKEIEWHCAHYVGRKLMVKVNNAKELAKAMKVPYETLKQQFDEYNKICEAKKDPFGKIFFHNFPWIADKEEVFHVAVITPVRHYCMGGISVNGHSQVRDAQNKIIPGLFATGEIMGGTHGANRLGGSSLLDCVAFGRVSGRSATRHLLFRQTQLTSPKEGVQVVGPQGKTTGLTQAEAAENDFAAAKTGGAAASKVPEYTMDDVAKHNKPTDCWMVVNGEVLDVTKFLDEHPGGREALLLFAGRNATEEFNMLHKPDVIAKFAPEVVIGKLKGAAKL